MKKHFTASALIFNDKKILLLFHKKLNVWLYPGGHIEENETPDEALVREVFEETGLNITILGSLDQSLGDNGVEVLHSPYCILCEKIAERHYHNDLIYLCEITNAVNDLKENPNESDGIGFFSQEELKGLKIFPNFRKLLIKAFRELV